MPKKNDNQVGESDGPAAGGGRQTPEQAAIVGTGSGGKTDAARNAGWDEAGGAPGRAPVAVGGSSQGQADRMPSGEQAGNRASNPAVTPGVKHSTS